MDEWMERTSVGYSWRGPHGRLDPLDQRSPAHARARARARSFAHSLARPPGHRPHSLSRRTRTTTRWVECPLRRSACYQESWWDVPFCVWEKGSYAPWRGAKRPWRKKRMLRPLYGHWVNSANEATLPRRLASDWIASFIATTDNGASCLRQLARRWRCVKRVGTYLPIETTAGLCSETVAAAAWNAMRPPNLGPFIQHHLWAGLEIEGRASYLWEVGKNWQRENVRGTRAEILTKVQQPTRRYFSIGCHASLPSIRIHVSRGSFQVSIATCKMFTCFRADRAREASIVVFLWLLANRNMTLRSVVLI